MKNCKSCGILTDQFYKEKTNKDGLRNICKTCDKARVKNYRKRNKEQTKKNLSEWYYNKKSSDPEWYANKIAKTKKANQERTKKNRNIITEFKSQGCSHCGYNKHPAALDCHHVGDKEFSLGSKLASATETQLKEELAKCIVLCANCHRIEHYSHLYPDN